VRRLSTASIACIGVCLSMSVHAQEAPPAGEYEVFDNAELVVTARKRDERLLDVPVAVSAFGQDQLEKADITSPSELSNFVPGLDFQNASAGTDGGGSNPNITFRGVRQQLSSASNQVGAIFWDGSYMGAGAGILPIEDLERIEVIKGPQTAYFGRNTFAGAINYIPRKAEDRLTVNGELLYSPSDDDSYKVALAVGTPIGDRAGLRLNFSHGRRGGDFTFGDGTPLNRQNRTTIGGTFRIEPIDDLNLKFSGYYATVSDTFVPVSIAADTPAGQCNRVFDGEYVNTLTGQRTPFSRNLATLNYAIFCGSYPAGTNANIITPRSRVPTAANTVGGDTSGSYEPNALMTGFKGLPDMPDGFGGEHRTWRAQLNGDYTLPGGHTIAWITSRSIFGSSISFDQNFGFGTTPLLVPRGKQTWIKEGYLEARVSSPQDKSFRYMAGVTYYDQAYRYGDTGTVKNINFEDNDSLSFFAALDFDLTDELTISGEGRYTKDRAFVLLNGDPRLPTTSSAVTYRVKNSFSKFIPRVIVSFKPTSDTNIYASYSRSALIGEQTNAAVVSSRAPDVLPDPDLLGDFTPPQTNTSYELGLKQKLPWGSFSIAVFHMKWENQVFRTSVLTGVDSTSFASPGKSKYTGVEVEFFARPSSWLDLSGGLLWVDAELVDYAGRSSFDTAVLGSGSLAVSANGNRPKGVAEWSGNIVATVHGPVFGREAYLRGDAIYRGSFFADNNAFDLINDVVNLNLRAGIEAVDGITFELYGKNLTDNRQLDPVAFTTTSIGSNRKIFTPVPTAREVGVRALIDF
jgi:iron complex outermembrane receptor protein